MKTAHSSELRAQRAIPACYMRGGTSKGVFFLAEDLPQDPVLRDRILLRVIGSPDPYGKQTDGMGAATSSTSKVVILSRSIRSDCDVDYLFGQVSIGEPLIDWSGNCGNLTAAVGPFAIHRGLVAARHDGLMPVRIWQANIRKRIVCHVPIVEGQVQEDGEFELDGVAFPAAEIPIHFLDPAGSDEQALFPTGQAVDVLEVPGVGSVHATLITAGNPTVLVKAQALGCKGVEMPGEFNRDAALLARCEAVRACGAVAMGLAATSGEATRERPATPKLALVSAPADCLSSGGKSVRAGDIDLTVRMLSMGMLHHALTGTGAIALAVGAAVPGTLVRQVIDQARRGGAPFDPAQLRLGHPSGILQVGAEASFDAEQWKIARAIVSRSARRLMDGQVFVPERCFQS